MVRLRKGLKPLKTARNRPPTACRKCSVRCQAGQQISPARSRGRGGCYFKRSVLNYTNAQSNPFRSPPCLVLPGCDGGDVRSIHSTVQFLL